MALTNFQTLNPSLRSFRFQDIVEYPDFPKNEIVEEVDVPDLGPFTILRNTNGHFIFEGKHKPKPQSIVMKEKNIVLTDSHYLNLTIEHATNVEVRGTVYIDGDFTFRADEFNNTHGKIHVAGNIKGKINFINNEGGQIVCANKIEIKIIGHSIKIPRIGTIKGSIVEILNRSENLSFFASLIEAKKEVCFVSDKLFHFVGDIQTPLLCLCVPDFNIERVLDIVQTVVSRYNGKQFTLSYPYKTTGTFEILAGRSDIGVFTTDTTENPPKEQVFDIRANIHANGGINIYAPSANVIIGDNAQNLLVEIVLNGSFDAHVKSLDLENAILSANNANIEAPSGITIGRLITDPSRQVFSTIYAHAKTQYAHNMGGHVHSASYKFLNTDVTNVYDGRHLFILPVAKSNRSIMHIKNSTTIKGPLTHQGQLLSTNNFTLESNEPSVCEAAQIQVNNKFKIIGGGTLTLKRHTGKLTFSYIYGNGHTNVTGRNVHTYVSSDPSICRVEGKLSVDPDSRIVNEASSLYAMEIKAGSKLESKDVASSLFQQIISGTPEQRAALNGGHGPLIVRHNNPIGNPKFRAYANYFLDRTGNFANSQKAFPANSSSGSTAILPANQIQLSNWQAPRALVLVGAGGVKIVGDLSRQNKTDLFYDPMALPINSDLVYVAKTLPTIYQKIGKPIFGYKLCERFGFDESDNQKFYQTIKNIVITQNLDNTFSKCKDIHNFIFTLSSGLLLEKMRQACSEKLNRGWIYPNQPMDIKMLIQLHINADNYLKQNKECLPTEPIVFYKIVGNELSPHFYFPIKMMEQAWGWNTDVLLVLSDGITMEEAVALFAKNPKLLEKFIEFFGKEKVLDLVSQYDQYQKSRSLPCHTDPVKMLTGPVACEGKIKAPLLGIINEGSVINHGEIETEDTFIASLYDNVLFQSIKERNYTDMNNFTERIKQKASIVAKNILAMYAGKNISFEGASTSSGKDGSLMCALSDIWDCPIALNSQSYKYREETFGRKRHRKTIKTTTVTSQTTHVPSKHYSEGTISMNAENKIQLYAIKVNSDGFDVIACNGVDFGDVHDTFSSLVTTESRTKRRWRGSKKQNNQTQSESSVSHGTELNISQNFTVSCDNGDIVFTNLTGKAANTILSALNKSVQFNQGNNTQSISSFCSKSNKFWKSQKYTSEGHQTFSGQKFMSPVIDITSNETIVQLVRGQSEAFIDQINQENGHFQKLFLDEIHTYYSHKIKGPTMALCMLVSAVTAIATAGAGTPLIGTIGLTGASMVSAAVSTLSSQAVVALMNTQDPTKALQILTSSKSLINLGIAVASAGLTDAAIKKLSLSPTGTQFSDHLKKNVTKTCISTVFKSIAGQKPNFVQTGVNIATDTIAAKIANEIGDSYHRQEICSFAHQLSHGMLGFGTAIVSNIHKPLLHNGLSGCIGAVSGETFAEMIESANLGMIACTLTAFATNQDIEITLNTASNAINNNYLHPTPYLNTELARLENANMLKIYLTKDVDEVVARKKECLIYTTQQLDDIEKSLNDHNLTFRGMQSLLEDREFAFETNEYIKHFPTTRLGITIEMTKTARKFARFIKF